MKHVLAIFALALLVGCMPPPPNVDELQSLDTGGAAPDSVQVDKAVRSYYEMSLFDPTSALYKFGRPTQAWYKSANEKTLGGWGVVFYINAKNRLGGYVGWSENVALFRNGEFVGIHEHKAAVISMGHLWGWR